MRLRTIADLRVPLIASSLAVLAGCAAKPIDGTVTTPPTVLQIFSTLAGSQSVLMYSGDPNDTGKTTATPPPSYDGFEIDFDQPMAASSVSNFLDRDFLDRVSACSPLASPSIKLLDVADGNRVIAASVCYDPASPVGGHPHATVIASNQVYSATATPFTCQEFSATSASDNKGEALKPNHQYALQFATAGLAGSNGQTLVAPTGPGWSNGTFSFTTSGFAIMAVGYVDPFTEYFHWLKKPFAGFEKDLLPEDGQNGRPSFGIQPTNASPLIVVFTEPVAKGSLADPNSTTGGQIITVTRKANSSPFPTFTTGENQRTLSINPGVNAASLTVSGVEQGSWEPGGEYLVNIGGGITSLDGSTLGTAVQYDVPAASTIPAGQNNAGQAYPLASVASTPGDGAIAQLSWDPEGGSLGYPGGLYASIVYQVPVDPASVTTANVTMTGPSGAVPVCLQVPANLDNQVVRVIPNPTNLACSVFAEDPVGGTSMDPTRIVHLKPGAIYTINAKNIKAQSGIPGVTSTAIVDFKETFTTANFRLYALEAGAGTGDIDRSLGNPADMPVNGTLSATFDDTATGVTATTLTLAEVDAKGNAVQVPIAAPSDVTTAPLNAGCTNQPASGCTGVSWSVKAASASYAVKFNQRYQVKASQAIKDPNGTPVTAEGCTTGDCSDTKSFTTAKFNVRKITPKENGVFKVTFSNEVLASSLVQGQFFLYSVDASGKLTAVPITCALPTDNTATSVTCRPNTLLTANNQSYLAAVAFTTSQPLKVAPTITGSDGNQYPADPVSGTFVGSVSKAFKTLCP